MSKKKQNNKAFTLIELIVTIAITGIFLGMVTIFLSSSLNLFGNAKKESVRYSNATEVVYSFDTFFNKINENGKAVTYTGNDITSNDSLDSISFSNSLIEVKISNKIVRSLNNENLTIEVIKAENEPNFGLIVKDENNRIIRSKVYYVIGGIS